MGRLRKYAECDRKAVERARVSHTAMVMRCTRPDAPSYPRYGGRGITVCDRWLKFADFLADMGPRPEGTSIDRIDSKLGYQPGNCRWATMQQQVENRTNSEYIEFQGERLSKRAWAAKFGLHDGTFRRRLSRGMSMEEISAGQPTPSKSQKPVELALQALDLIFIKATTGAAALDEDEQALVQRASALLRTLVGSGA